jgi:N-acetylmuramoyl-L-alanine amidase
MAERHHGGARARRAGGVAALAIVAIVVSGCAPVLGLTLGSAGRNPQGGGVPAASAGPAISGGAGGLPLAGKVVGVDPGHNGGNFTHAADIGRLVWNGREFETCNTTGTETDLGYTEAQFNFDVASYLRAYLVADGARVVMTRTNDDGVGPCVNKRAAMINDAHADVGIAIHADGAIPSGRGFAVLVPVADGPNDQVIAPSAKFAGDLRAEMLAGTPMPVSNYDGVDAIKPRDNLAGLNLTQVPMALIEVGNMRNATDAALLVSPAFQQEAAKAILAAIVDFLTGLA